MTLWAQDFISAYAQFEQCNLQTPGLRTYVPSSEFTESRSTRPEAAEVGLLGLAEQNDLCKILGPCFVLVTARFNALDAQGAGQRAGDRSVV